LSTTQFFTLSSPASFHFLFFPSVLRAGKLIAKPGRTQYNLLDPPSTDLESSLFPGLVSALTKLFTPTFFLHPNPVSTAAVAPSILPIATHQSVAIDNSVVYQLN
jgi:hypothetical protein